MINGIVFSADHKPVEDALVSVITVSNNHILTTFSDSSGYYQLENLFADSVYLEVSTLNSEKKIMLLKLSPGENVTDTICLEENLLDEVVVTAGAYAVKRETDRLLMNINPYSDLIKNSNIWNAMRIIPSVSISELEGISMIGKQDVSIFINGRKSMLSFTALKSYLESMPAGNIQTIELIYNPGAAFNTGSNTGIINITLRKPDSDGLKGMASAAMWQTHYNKQTGSLNLNYRKNNVAVISSFSGRNLHDWNAFTTEREFLDTQQQIIETGSRNNRRPILIGHIDVLYELNEKNKIGIAVGVEYVNFHPDVFTASAYKRTGSNKVDSIVSSSSVSDNRQLRIVNNLNYTFTNGHSIFKFDADFLTDQTKENYLFETSHLTEIYSRYKQYYPQHTKMWSFKTEYNYTKGKLGIIAGLESYVTASENRNEYRDIIKTAKPLHNNEYVYKEKSIAGFLSGNIRWNEKFSSRMGARLVYTNTNGELRLPDKDLAVHSYKNLNPSLSLSYIPAEQHNFWYNMSIRDNYYKFTYLNPVRIYQSADSYHTGNPDLKPSRTCAQDIGYNLKSMYMFLFGYNVTENGMGIFTLPQADSMTESKPVNYGNENNIYLVCNINKPVLNRQLFLNISLDGSYTCYKSKMPETGTSENVFNGGVKISGTFIPSKFNTWQVISDIQYRSPFKTMVWHYSNSLRGSIEISKRLNDFSVSMYGFYSLQYSEGRFSTDLMSNYRVEDYISNSVSKGEYSGIMLSVTYRFGNNKVKSGANRVTSISSIQNRLKDNK
ncbi:MAG: outer membrane beta-barrel protein [Tannerella sp.]|nr:outer membrane beta-barrel protein [Tannerella sp.]